MTDADLTTETWKPVLGYEGLYEVSDLGRVRNLTARKQWKPGRVLFQTLTRCGYFCVALYDGPERRKNKTIHRAVVEAFIGPIGAGMTVNHINAIKTDNRLPNLEIATMKQQMAHAIALGLIQRKAILTADQVLDIRRQLAPPYQRGTVPRIASSMAYREDALLASKVESDGNTFSVLQGFGSTANY